MQISLIWPVLFSDYFLWETLYFQFIFVNFELFITCYKNNYDKKYSTTQDTSNIWAKLWNQCGVRWMIYCNIRLHITYVGHSRSCRHLTCNTFYWPFIFLHQYRKGIIYFLSCQVFLRKKSSRKSWKLLDCSVTVLWLDNLSNPRISSWLYSASGSLTW